MDDLAEELIGDLRKDAVGRAAVKLGGERVFAGGAVDVRDEKSVQAFFAAAERALGPPHHDRRGQRRRLSEVE